MTNNLGILSNVKVSLTHKFKTKKKVFPRGVEFNSEEIVNRIAASGWFFSGYSYEENQRMFRNAIHLGLVNKRILHGSRRGQYIFV